MEATVPDKDVPLFFPPISTIGQYEGWNDEVTASFFTATRKVLNLNPVLLGRVKEKDKEEKTFGIFSMKQLFKEEELLQEVDLRRTLPASTLLLPAKDASLREKMLALRDLSFIPKQGSGLDLVQSDKPSVFRIDVFRMSDDRAILFFSIFHGIADLATAKLILGQISDVMQNRPVTLIDWDRGLDNMIFPAHYTLDDLKNNSVPSPMEKPSLNDISLIDREAMEQLKRSMVSTDKCEYITSNDIITAGMAQAFKADCIQMPFNYRAKQRNEQEDLVNVGWNYLYILTMDGASALDPNLVHMSIDKQIKHSIPPRCKWPVRLHHSNWVALPLHLPSMPERFPGLELECFVVAREFLDQYAELFVVTYLATRSDVAVNYPAARELIESQPTMGQCVRRD